jgi:hypothetical protein
VINKLSVKGRQISDTRRRMAKAKNYYEWLKCAERMDELEGKNRWREVPESGYYNHRMLQEKINQLNNMMQNGDVFQVRTWLCFVVWVGLIDVTMPPSLLQSGRQAGRQAGRQSGTTTTANTQTHPHNHNSSCSSCAAG